MFDRVIETPVGFLGIGISNRKLRSVRFVNGETVSAGVKNPFVEEVATQLKAYFETPRYRFDLPLDLQGTAFQTAVWRSLRRIPPGEVRTYGEIARELGTGARAVGNACRSNPCPIVVPCHRVVAATGPGGYAGRKAGKSLRVKRWLLEHEGIRLRWS